MNRSYIACVAGKSGGHIIPCLTYARTIKSADQGIIFFSNNTPLDYALLQHQPDVIFHAPMELEARRSFKTIVHFLKGIFFAFKHLRRYRPTEVVSTGGIVSLPVFIAAWLLRIPCVLFELNAIPGKASSWCAPFASRINVCFASAQPYFAPRKTTVERYPLKPEIVSAAREGKIENKGLKTVLVLGGSQGSVSLNSLVKKMIEHHPDLAQKIMMIHQTGSNDQTDWAQWYVDHGIGAKVFAFDNNLIPYYQQADIIIARAGAGTLFEIVAFKKKSIIVPLEIKQTDHQVDNALAIAKEYPDLCTVIREKTALADHAILYDVIIS